MASTPPKNLLVTEDLIDHMKAAFPPKPYSPGMLLEEIAFNQGTQLPIEHLEYLLRKRNARAR